MTKTISAINLAAALSLANAGFRVFPARAIFNPATGRWNKPPCLSDWQTLATADPDKVINWWRQFPDSIPAISCKEIIVIDADRHAGGPDGVAALAALIEQHGDWPDPPSVLTPSNGQHHYLKQPEPPLRNRTGQLPDGIDVRGNGGYIIGPGALLPDETCYRSIGPMELAEAFATGSIPSLPDWLEKLVRADWVVPTNASTYGESRVTQRERNYAEAVLETVVHEIQTAPRGRRNSTLNSVAYRLGRMVGAGWIDCYNVETRLLAAAARLRHEDGDAAVKATIKSGIDAGIRKPHPDLVDRKWSGG